MFCPVVKVFCDKNILLHLWLGSRSEFFFIILNLRSRICFRMIGFCNIDTLSLSQGQTTALKVSERYTVPMLRGFQLCLLVTLHHTVRKKFTKIEISINIYRWGGVKVTFRWHFNDIWHSLHLRSKYSLISIFIPIFFFQCSNFLTPSPLPPPPSTIF